MFTSIVFVPHVLIAGLQLLLEYNSLSNEKKLVSLWLLLVLLLFSLSFFILLGMRLCIFTESSIGISNVNVDPNPSPSDDTKTRQLCKSAIAFDTITYVIEY